VKIVLKGNWPATLTAGILLLSRGRSFGLPVTVNIVGDPKDIEEVKGPTVVSCQVLASCGVGRELGDGPLVVVTGGSVEPVLVSLDNKSDEGWFLVDSSGEGRHPATRALVRMVRDPSPCARHATRLLLGLFRWAGIPAEPALIDLLFGAPADALTRVGMALQASATFSDSRVHRSVSERLNGGFETPLSNDGLDGERIFEMWHSGELDKVLGALPAGVSVAVEDWLSSMEQLSALNDGESDVLVAALGSLLGNVLLLPQGCMLPVLDPTHKGLAVGIVNVLGAKENDSDTSRSLLDVFRFLGGRFEPFSQYPFQLSDTPAPAGRKARWRWLIDSVEQGAEQMEVIWKEVMSPTS
jgi:hypothetical protein